MKPFEMTGWQDINNFFNRAQPVLHKDFAKMERPLGVWGDWVEYAGTFPTGTGTSARVTLMGTRRPRHTNRWDRMAALQPDCAVSGDPVFQNIPANAWDNRWYSLFQTGFRSPVYNMTAMWTEGLALPEQIENIERNLKEWLDEILDDYYRGTYIATCANKWLGVDNNNSYIRKGLWDFAKDANGDPNIEYIVLDPSVAATDLSNLSLLTQDVLDYLDFSAFYNRSWNFLDSSLKPLMIDVVTAQRIPKEDQNQRNDNRFIDPDSLDRRLGYIRNYAGWGYKPDMFQLRYNWTLDDPLYPLGVLKRVYHWTDSPISSGVTEEGSTDYANASFAIAIPGYNPEVVKYQNFAPPKSVGKDAKFDAVTHAYEGIYTWINECNNITPSNETKELGYWLASIRKAGKPKRYDLGHVVLYRLYDTPGVRRSQRPLSVSLGGSPLYDLTCPPLDQFPAPLAVRTICGTFTKAGCQCSPCTDRGVAPAGLIID
jgi:hypothetical protein